MTKILRLQNGMEIEISHFHRERSQVLFRMGDRVGFVLWMDDRELLDFQNAVNRPQGKDWKPVGVTRPSTLKPKSYASLPKAVMEMSTSLKNMKTPKRRKS